MNSLFPGGIFLSEKHLCLSRQLSGNALALHELLEIIRAELAQKRYRFSQRTFGMVDERNDDGIVADPIAALCNIANHLIRKTLG